MFYKYENNDLTYGPFVLFPTGEFLSKDTIDSVTLTFEGFYYFETEKEAKDFFGIKE